MKRSYLKNEILQLEDILENELSLPFLVENIPNEVTLDDTINSKQRIIVLLQEKYDLIIQIPTFPIYKALLNSNVIVENEFFKLISINQTSYNEEIWELMCENEYSNSWTFFLLKSIENVKFSLPTTSSERILVREIGRNEIFYFRLELNELTICKW